MQKPKGNRKIDHLERGVVTMRIILKDILKLGMVYRSVFVWLRIGRSGGVFF